MTRWINTFEVICPNPEKEEGWIQWYMKIHAPDILDTPGFLTARLCRRKEFRDGRGQFFTIYEIESDDIERTIKIRQEKRASEIKAGRGHTAVLPLWRDVIWKELIVRTSDNKPVPHVEQWINLVEVNCIDSSKEQEFNIWYNNTHLADVLETPGFIAATRYEMKEFRDGRGKYLTIYEIGTDNIDRTMAVRKERRKQEREKGRQSNLWVPVWNDVLWRLLFELTKR